MKVSSKRLENCEVMLTIEVDDERVESALRQAARKVSRETNIPGFRRGKAPYHMVVQMFGRETLLQEALDDLGQEVFKEALEETEIEPFAQTDLVDVQFDPMVLKLSVPIAPVVDLGDYRKLRLDPLPTDITDEEIEAELGALREQNVSWVPAERGAEMGDRVTYTLKVEDNDEDAEDSVPRELVLTEDSRFPAPGFNEQLLGAKASESRDFEVTYPDDWPAEALAGTTEELHIEVGEVKQKELPALEDLPALVGDYDDLDALKESLHEDLVTRKEAQNDRELLEKARDILGEGAVVESPKLMVDEEIETMLKRHDSALRDQGLDLESYLKVMKKDREAYMEDLRPDAVKQVKGNLVLGKLAELEGLKVEPDELQQQIAERSLIYGEASEELQEVLSSPGGRQYLAADILTGKAFDRLLEIVKGEAPELETEDSEPDETEGETESGAEPDAEEVTQSEAEADPPAAAEIASASEATSDEALDSEERTED